MNHKVHHIRKQFPEKKQSIDFFIAEDSGFLALCEDYDVCVNALDYWKKSTEPEAEARRKEYRNLVQELEEEVTQALATMKPKYLD